MDLRRELERFDPDVPVEASWMPPSSWYVAPELWALEQRAVFQRSWQPVARRAELAQPGSYASGRHASLTWVVVCDEAGELHAFHNACRHKGREVVQGAGRAEELVCGYHAWCYDHEGRLKRAPGLGRIEGFEREAMSLPPLAVDVFGPWVFVNADLDAPPVAKSFPEVAAAFDAAGWSGLAFAGEQSWDLACNWKVYVDNYLDGGYHIPHMHPTLDAQIDMSSYRTEVFERSSIQRVAPKRAPDARIDYDAGERIGEEALYAWLYPAFMLNRYGPCLDTNLVLPLAPDCCRVVYEFWFDETRVDDPDAFRRRSIEQSAVTQEEDIAICESVQVGLSSPAYDRGRYAQAEVGEHHFHGLLQRALLASLAV